MGLRRLLLRAAHSLHHESGSRVSGGMVTLLGRSTEWDRVPGGPGARWDGLTAGSKYRITTAGSQAVKLKKRANIIASRVRAMPPLVVRSGSFRNPHLQGSMQELE